MINFIEKIIENMKGKKLSALLAETDGATITERTFRNWRAGKSQPTAAQIEAVKQINLRHVQKILSQNELPELAIKEYLESLVSVKGMVSSLIHGLYFISPGSHLPYTFALAVRIDELINEWQVCRETDQPREFANFLRNANWLTLDYFKDLSEATSNPEAVQSALNQAKTWDDLTKPMGLIYYNLIMQLLATLDLEYSAKWLCFEATPTFQSLLPRLKPGCQLSTIATMPLANGMFQLPVHRLLDLMTCLSHFYLKARWPSKMPTVKEIAMQMDVTAEQITKWRRGRRFTARDYTMVWNAMLRDHPEQERPPPHYPLLLATTMFTCLFVQGKREKPPFGLIIPDQEWYGRWWEIQYKRLTVCESLITFGSAPWMPELDTCD